MGKIRFDDVVGRAKPLASNFLPTVMQEKLAMAIAEFLPYNLDHK